MTIEQLKKALANQQFAKVYLVLGQESALIEQVHQLFQAVLPEAEQTMNYASYDMQTTELAVALNDAESTPFFGERRVVLIQNAYFLTGEKSKNKLVHDLTGLQAYLQQPLETTALVFFVNAEKLDERKKVVKLLKQQAEIIDVQKLSEVGVKQRITRDIQTAGLKIEPVALNQLLLKINGDYSRGVAELPKLKLYAAQAHLITEQAVEDLVSTRMEDNVFNLVPLVLQRQVGPVLQMYRELLLQKEEPLKINAILLGQFRLLLQTKILFEKGYTQGNLASVLKSHPYRIKLALQQNRHFSKETLVEAYLGLSEIEIKLKTTQTSPGLLFELFMLQFAQTQQKRA